MNACFLAHSPEDVQALVDTELAVSQNAIRKNPKVSTVQDVAVIVFGSDQLGSLGYRSLTKRGTSGGS